MRLLTWLASITAELWTRRRWRCSHDFDDTHCWPPSCRLCGRPATPSPDWGC